MKLRQTIKRTLLIAAMSASSICADNRIVMYLRHAPQSILDAAERDANKQILREQTPGQQAATLLQAKVPGLLKPSLGGIAAVYGGYFAISSTDGLISFPLRHTAQKVYLAITPSIQLVRLKGNTFSHRAFLPAPAPTSLFSIELNVDKHKRSYWQVRTEPLPDDLVINPLTVVILTQPSNIVVPNGDFLATDNQQLVLPEAMLISREGNEACLLKATLFKQHFESITVEQKKGSDNCLQAMIQNI